MVGERPGSLSLFCFWEIRKNFSEALDTKKKMPILSALEWDEC